MVPLIVTILTSCHKGQVLWRMFKINLQVRWPLWHGTCGTARCLFPRDKTGKAGVSKWSKRLGRCHSDGVTADGAVSNPPPRKAVNRKREAASHVAAAMLPPSINYTWVSVYLQKGSLACALLRLDTRCRRKAEVDGRMEESTKGGRSYLSICHTRCQLCKLQERREGGANTCK